MIEERRLTPTDPQSRVIALDVLRGFAVLGILIMNIQSFALIEALYLNPTAYGDLTGANLWIWALSHIFADQKFMTIFSILFGAGIVLISNRASMKGMGAVSFHYRRIFWLFIIGLIHAYLLWHGDILVPYALCGFMVFILRKTAPRRVFIIGLILLSVSSAIYYLSGLALPYWPEESYQGVLQVWSPPLDLIHQEIRALRGNWFQQMAHRVPASLRFETSVFFFWTFWRVSGLMLMGMALYKWGYLTGEKSKKQYLAVMSVGLGLGIPIILAGIHNNFSANWSLDYSMFKGWQYNYWGSLFAAAGYIALIMLFSQSKILTKLKDSLAAVGRMALTNYLLQTAICTTIFYGHGFGLFQKIERPGQILIVVIIWIIQLIVSPIWLKYFRFGPMEWLWRSFTYFKWQPFKNLSVKGQLV